VALCTGVDKPCQLRLCCKISRQRSTPSALLGVRFEVRREWDTLDHACGHDGQQYDFAIDHMASGRRGIQALPGFRDHPERDWLLRDGDGKDTGVSSLGQADVSLYVPIDGSGYRGWMYYELRFVCALTMQEEAINLCLIASRSR